jgi:hypothetical protein
MYTINQEKTVLTLEPIAKNAIQEKISETAVHHHSDGSELIPAEVQAKMRSHGGQLLDTPETEGYTSDDEGIVNAYAIEPVMYFAEYPTHQEQHRYLFQGAIAALIITMIVFIAFSVS